MTEDQGTNRRSWKSRLLELAAWACVSVATAVIMILLSGKILPANF
jgi:negative regulator of sigma E activity